MNVDMYERRKISIVVPCYNVTVCIDKCMESLLNQTIGLDNIEIILVDDASTDNGATVERLLEYEKKFPDVIMVVLQEENGRQGGARNAGIRYATGEYLLFCDADDYLSLCAAERLYHAAQIYQADVVEFRLKEIEDYTEIDPTLVSGDQGYLLDLADENVRRAVLGLSNPDFGLGCMNKLYRMELIRDHEIRFAEHLIYEEPSFTLPVRCYEQRHLYLDEVLYYYLQWSDSTMHGSGREHDLDSLKVWNGLMEELEQRGLLNKYYYEFGKMYYSWGFVLTLSILMRNGQTITKELFYTLREVVEKRFPQLRENPMLLESNTGCELAILDIEYEQTMQPELEKLVWRCIRQG